MQTERQGGPRQRSRCCSAAGAVGPDAAMVAAAPGGFPTCAGELHPLAVELLAAGVPLSRALVILQREAAHPTAKAK